MNHFLIFVIFKLFRQIAGFFEDKLDYFSKLGLDYIGAPWMVDGFDGKPKEQLWKVGNGGFSLRKVKTFKSIIKQIESSPKGKVPVFKYKKITLKGIIKNFGFRNNLKHYINESPGEDIFGVFMCPMFSQQNNLKLQILLLLPVTLLRYFQIFYSEK